MSRRGRVALVGLAGILVAVTTAALLWNLWTVSSVQAIAGLLPLSGKVIAIDPGHGGYDPGAVGVATQVRESDLNLQISGYLRQELESLGASVVFTRESDVSLADRKKEDLQARVDILNQSGCDAAVSIHMNKFYDTRASGAQTFYGADSPEGEALARAIQARLVAVESGMRKLQPMHGDYYLLNKATVPCAIVECGFVSHAEEEQLLQTEAHQRQLAVAIALGVKDALLAAAS